MKRLLALALSLGLALGLHANNVLEGTEKAEMGNSNPSRSFLSSANATVEVHVSDAASGTAGRFTIGTIAGERLLYGHGASDPWSTYIRMSVDGFVYAPGSGGTFDGNLNLTAGPTMVGTSIVTTWAGGGVSLTQTLTPDVIGGQGTIRIEYDVANNDGQAHDVRLLLEMDTQIDANDAAPLSTSYGYAAVETCYSGAAVPNIWQAFEVDPSQDPAFLVGCGTLSGFGATLPDQFAVGQWSSFYGATFGYACDNQSYGDSAVLLWWETGTMSDGSSAHYQTYYGTCSTTSVPGDLNLSLGGNTAISCDNNGTLTPNPFDANVLVTNTGGSDCENVIVSITAGPGLSVVGASSINLGTLGAGGVGAAPFSLMASGNPCDEFLNYTIVVTSDTCPSNTAVGTVFVPCCDVSGTDDLPVAFELGQNFPNPFNPTTQIAFNLGETGQVQLAVYNLNGALVATLLDSRMARGAHEVTFDASELNSGVYIYTLKTEQGSISKKMILMK